eukprot:133411-Pyramimonas_sp.AAC.1
MRQRRRGEAGNNPTPRRGVAFEALGDLSGRSGRAVASHPGVARSSQDLRFTSPRWLFGGAAGPPSRQ